MLDVCSATPYETHSPRKSKHCLKKPHKKRVAGEDISKSSLAGTTAQSDGSSLDASLSQFGGLYSSVPMPRYAREPVDVLEELSSRIMMLPASQGRLFSFLRAFTPLAKEGCIFVAKGVIGLPETDAACYEALAKLVLPQEKSARTAVRHEVRKQLEMPEPTVFGTPEDDRIRTTYSYVMAFLLQQMIQANDALGMFSLNSSFSCPPNKVPSISLLLFIQRVMRYLPATKELYIIALIYLDRVLAVNPDLCFTLFNAHRLFVSAILIASKFMDDLFYTNAFVSKVAGISSEELNRLEIEFLAAIRFSLYVKPEVFQSYADNFNQLVAVCNMLPLEAVVKSAPCHCSPLIRSSYSVVDEMFLHIETERQRISMASPAKQTVFIEPPPPSTLKAITLKIKCRDDSCSSADELTLSKPTPSGKKSSVKAPPISFKRPSALLSPSSRCSTEASCCSSCNSSCSSWSCSSQDL